MKTKPTSRIDRINTLAAELIRHGMAPVEAVTRATREIDDADQSWDGPSWHGKGDPDTVVRFV